MIKKIFILITFLFNFIYATGVSQTKLLLFQQETPVITIPTITIPNEDIVITSPTPSIPQEIITTSLLIIFVEVSALGILYGLGRAFSYQKLISYSKGEFTQALANIILIGVISALLLDVDIFDAIKSLPEYLKDNIAHKIIGYSWGIIFWNAYASSVASFSVDLEVHIPLVVIPVTITLGMDDIQIIDGIAPFLDVVDRLISFFSDAYIFIIATEVFIKFIIEMSPILLYLGLLLRVIPWTRTAGGYLIAFFLVFYFFYPLLLLFFFSLDPFKQVNFTENWFWTYLKQIVPHPSMALLEIFTIDFLNLVVKFILPLILCFIVSLMVVDELGDIFGSFLTKPSLFKLV